MDKYIFSKKPFDGYLFRFRVKLHTKERNVSVDIYSNTSSSMEVNNMIAEKSSLDVLRWSIISINSKEDDDNNSKFLDEVLN